MANIRNIKKDISFVVNELVVECFTYSYLFPDKNKEELATIISETLEMGNELTTLVNQVKGTKDIPAKKQFKKIREEFDKKIVNLVEKLEKLEKV